MSELDLEKIKKIISIKELEVLSNDMDILPGLFEKILDQCIKINLLLFVESDFREHLMLSNIITRNYSFQNENANVEISTLMDNDELNNGINQWKKIIYKTKCTLIENKMGKYHKISIESIRWILKCSITLILIYFNELSKLHKKNVLGIIKLIEPVKNEIYSDIPLSTIDQLQSISAKNRKRTNHYQRGFIQKKDYYAIIYPIVIVSIIVLIYIYYYYNLL